jgi:hypothetical protein
MEQKSVTTLSEGARHGSRFLVSKEIFNISEFKGYTLLVNMKKY